MNQGFTSIPFKAEKHQGLSTVNGVAKFSPAGIVLEFEAKLFGIIAGGVKEIKLAIGELLDVKFRKGFMRRGAKIEIRTKAFSTLAELPNSDGKVTLKIERDDFDRARSAVEQIQKDLSEFEGAQPPPHTPVSRLFDDTEDETKILDR